MPKKKKEERIGKVVQVIGAVVDVEFRNIELPKIYNAVRITSEGYKTPVPVDIICEVELHLFSTVFNFSSLV